MTARVLEQAYAELAGAGASMRCVALGKLLENLGFEVRDGKRGGHKIFVHDGIPGFTSGAYNCDHGRNPEIKRPYINKVLKILKQYEAELTRYLEEQHD
ncbi:MAG TPA: type II toxin-antitoxin system HicA family toxin [Rhodanobacteraceae bacterium]|nr:type II toxin-antitoxin system HicA family toxin [Rhodanobacteraceae bacterium]